MNRNVSITNIAMAGTTAMMIIMVFVFACSNPGEKNVSQGSEQDAFRVMTFNMWVGGEAGGQPISKSIDVIRMSGAQVVGIQESYTYKDGSVLNDNGLKIAKTLGWNYFSQGSSGILTSYSIVDSTENKLGIKLKISDDQFLWFFNCHLFHMPYQPYQLAGKRYGEFPFISTEQEAITFAQMTRQADVNKYVKEINQILTEGWPVILTGDFNEPSFLDWTEAAVNAKFCPVMVEWPSTKAFADLGMTDAYRTIFPDEVLFRGETWSSISTPGEIHDRIDFVFFKGEQLKVKGAQTIGFEDGKSDIGMLNYPSDHRAVYADFVWIK